MGLYNKLADDIEEVDVIIAGGGTAACIVASRLADADPNLSILVIEQGKNNYEVPTVVHPLFYLAHLVPGNQTAIFYKGNRAERLGDREPIVPSGGILGGGSSINFTMYTRAQRDDYDAWNTKGWSADDLWPYLKKFETYHGPGDKEDHGSDGPINVGDGTFREKLTEDDFIAAMGQLGYPEIRDLNNLDTNNGVQRWSRFVGPDGRRQDTAHRYLHPRLRDGRHPNLHVVVESQVVRVLFDEGGDEAGEGKGGGEGVRPRATGVEYRPNPAFQAQGLSLTQTPVRAVRARRLVVLACGACGTPLVLERSGVGDPKVLRRAGVPAVVADVPGVGRGYQDHNLLLVAYRTSLGPGATLDQFASGRATAESLIRDGDPRLGWNTIDAACKLRPTEAEVDALGPAFRAAWDRDFKDAPNRPLMLMGKINGYLGDHAAVPAGQYITLAPYTAYPYSRGHMHITGPGLDDPIDFETGFFSDADDIDLKKMMWAYKLQREAARRMATFRGELATSHPPFAAGSGAAVLEEADGPTIPAAAAAERWTIAYAAEDDAVLERWLRGRIETTWHSLGTCRMAPRDEGGVVGADLGVHGVRGLKVADVSVPPANVAANTNTTALVIGERAADIFIRELGLARSS